MTKPHKTRRRKPPRPIALQEPNAEAFTIKGYQAIGGPGKTKIYELGKAGVLEVFKDAIGRTLITGSSARKFLQPS